ncbi:uncharacterized protein DFR58_10168 [Anaerobacterium chartisolvens]|uniref:Radical SAM core domain-containing protein n=1 Tax=Anaerobacterium chartisolvens TaxID=1297424 RepID=A0A369BJW4_9FIRM|nr:radical SAM peptide maturase, CXXX-repeat target family [Anaerobacterium chartisolvens]RCX20866.1 uncharacterized protein DFR58_10168 [Anaerobacterium chartisolvens]
MVRSKIQGFQDIYPLMYPELQCTNISAVENVTFIVTWDCSLRCKYCYEGNKDTQHRMSLETAKRAVDFLFEEDRKHEYIGSNPNSAIILEFIGGEPLLETDLIDSTIEYFRHKALQERHRWALHHMISISTNGVNYETSRVQRFVEKYKERLSISISIDGNKQLHDSCRVFPNGSGSYDVVESAFKLYLKQSGHRTTKLTIAPDNVMHLSEACTHLYEMGLQDILSNCVYEKGWTVEHARTLYKEMKKLADYLLQDNRYERYTNSLFDELIGHPMPEEDNQNWCGGTGKMLAIDNEGLVYPCLRYTPLSLRAGLKPIVIGDIHTGIATTAKHKEDINCLKCITRKSQSTQQCFACPIASGCAWCSAYNYEEAGTPNKRVTYICVMHQARVLANIYYWNKLYKQLDMDKQFKNHVPEQWAMDIAGKMNLQS